MTDHHPTRLPPPPAHPTAPRPDCDRCRRALRRRPGRSRALLGTVLPGAVLLGAVLLGAPLLGVMMVDPALAASAKAPTAPAKTAPPAAEDPAAPGNYDRCLAMTHAEPAAALTKAEAWRNAGGGFPADHCAAVALIGLKRYSEAATRLEAMAGAMMKSDPSLRADALEQAGQAWLLAEKPAEAKSAFDAALAFKHDDPDLLIDRAQTYAEAGKYWDAIDDLNRAIEQVPYRADALIFRASAYRRVPDGLDLAMQDVEQALKLAPDMPAGLLERGNIRALKGDVAGARADWQRVEKVAPRSADALAAKNNLSHVGEQADKAPGDKGQPDKAPDAPTPVPAPNRQ